MKVKEDNIKQKEASLLALEETLKAKEEYLIQKENELIAKEKSLNSRDSYVGPSIQSSVISAIDNRDVHSNVRFVHLTENDIATTINTQKSGSNRMSIESNFDMHTNTETSDVLLMAPTANMPTNVLASNIQPCAFQIYSDKATEDTTNRRFGQGQFNFGDDASSVARARELLNRPRIGDVTKPKTVIQRQFTGGDMKENQPYHQNDGKVINKRNTNRPPPPPPQWKKNEAKLRSPTSNDAGEFSSPAKRYRSEIMSNAYGNVEGVNMIPSIQVDLQALIGKK